ncbi:AMP-binding protein [Chelatococcus reniformis]|uniref:Acyl-CoA synthetase n=1 Tax=Chelatococcus reniformis TaxID=1494448 RepID=A0A916XQU5_9HYPH|nr:AMP-binding protein [Chelatococcus reniformis]GGC93371.1 acyl-CoA synthetase [Chelatococcus reniformis]
MAPPQPIDENAYLGELQALYAKAWPAGLDRTIAYTHGERPLTDYLGIWARTRPDKPAVIFYGAVMTYRELDELSDRFAALLAGHGIGKGDRVSLYLPNCPQFHVAFFGILKLGAVHCPVSPLSKAFELAYQVKDCGSQVILAQDQLMPVVREVLVETGIRKIFVTSFADVVPAEPSIPAPAAVRAPAIPCPDAIDLMPALAAIDDATYPPGATLDDVAALNYTGGTTGLPKGCVHTQRDMIYTVAANMSLAPPPDDSVSLSFFPEFWMAGENSCLVFPVYNGATLVLLTRWDPVTVMSAIEHYRVTATAMPVDGALEIMDHPRFHEFDLSSLVNVRVVSFVKKLTIDYRRRWQHMVGTTLAESAWGMTETQTSDTFTTGMQDDDFDLKSRPTFVGLPVPGTQFKICDFETGAIVPLGTEGEICCRSPSLLKSYWNKPEATRDALRDGWLHTGDIGVIDAQGYLFFLGRRKEMIKVKGMSVFPGEIEAILGQHPAVAASGVVPRPDPERGQVPVAFVLLKPEQTAGAEPGAMEAWCRERMASFKTPEVRFVAALPMTATGKVKKNELGELLKPA